MNYLKQLFILQEELQKKLNYSLENNEARKIMILSAIDELTECLREIPWKPWKKHQIYNKENYKNEIIDLWHFVINITLSSGMNWKELYKRFQLKNQINHKRKKQGY